MKRALVLTAAVSLFCANAFATYIVVLRNGTTYKAKSKWTVSGGKALVALESGPVLQLDPGLIDPVASERATASGLGGATILQRTDQEPAPVKEQGPSLGASIRLRKIPGAQPGTSGAAAPSTPAVAPSTNGSLSQEVIDKFARAYENVGLFEQSLKSTSATTLRAELTADTEDKVFNAISATSFLMVRNAGVANTKIDMVELFMKTTNGGSAGRFQMTREDADALDSRKISQQDYFVRRVIY